MKKLLLFITAIFICGAAIAQTETTKWYIEGELYDTTSCESGNDITMPQVPERFGYTFSGWEPAVYDMSTLDTSINGVSYTYDGTRRWSVQFSYGTVYGEKLCSPTGNDPLLIAQGIDTQTGYGRYCWCRITEFIPFGSDTIYEPKFSSWVFNKDYFNASCNINCATSMCRGCSCGDNVKFDPVLRASLYGI